MTSPTAASVTLAPGLRAMTEKDLGAVTALHRKAFVPSVDAPDAALSAHLRDLFFDHPWKHLESPVPSLLCEEGGEVVGCLGAMPRPMRLGGEALLCVVSHNFMVAPSHRTSTIALRMLRTVFGGPQDLSLAEGNDPSRRLWKALGGEVPTSYTLRWTQPLRPARYALSRLGRGGGRGVAAAALRPFGAMADAVAGRLPGTPLRSPGRPGAGVVSGPLDPAAHAEVLERVCARRTLSPVWEPETLERAVEILADSPGRGPLHGRVLRREGLADEPGQAQVLGGYLYELKADGVAAVVQLAATEKTAHAVLDHLAAHARGAGAVAVTGQVDPALLPVLSERPCLFHRGKSTPWLVVHSREERIRNAFHRGEAFFTHLEGEWWV